MIAEISSTEENVTITFTSGSDKIVLEFSQAARAEVRTPAEPKRLVTLK